METFFNGIFFIGIFMHAYFLPSLRIFLEPTAMNFSFFTNSRSMGVQPVAVSAASGPISYPIFLLWGIYVDIFVIFPLYIFKEN
jgi:hypothetical protein